MNSTTNKVLSRLIICCIEKVRRSSQIHAATVTDLCGDRHNKTQWSSHIIVWYAEIVKKEKAYAQYPLPKFYNFSSVGARKRILYYSNFLKANQKVKDMIAEIQEFYNK